MRAAQDPETVAAVLSRALLLDAVERETAAAWAARYGADVTTAVEECTELRWLLALACELGQGRAVTSAAHDRRANPSRPSLPVLRAHLDLATMHERLARGPLEIAAEERARVAIAVSRLRRVARRWVPGIVSSAATGAIVGTTVGSLSRPAADHLTELGVAMLLTRAESRSAAARA